MHTLDDYKAAKPGFERLKQQWENYSGNNTNKIRASITTTKVRVRSPEFDLKVAGPLARTPQEELRIG